MFEIKTYDDIKNTILENVIINEQVFNRLGANNIEKFLNKYDSYYSLVKLTSRHNALLAQIRDSHFQRDFKNLMVMAYGDHVTNILNNRPNLSLNTVIDFRVFDKNIYDVMGENFVNQLLNFSYGRLNPQYDKIIDSFVLDKENVKVFKYMLGFIGDTKEDIYNYSLGFVTYGKYSELFKTLYKSQEKVTPSIVSKVKDIILFPENNFYVANLDDVMGYDNKVRRVYNKLIVENGTNLKMVARCVLERFFGVRLSDIEPDQAYRSSFFYKNNIFINEMIDYYNIARLVAIEENAESLNRKRYLTDSELKLLKLVLAVNKIVESGLNSERGKLIALYKKLDEASQNPKTELIRPGDFVKLLNKIPKIYEEDIKEKITTVKDLDQMIENKYPGIRLESITKVYNGKEYKIPVYRLEGARFSLITTSVEHSLSGNYVEHDTLVDDFLGIEKGMAQISCSNPDYLNLCALEFSWLGEGRSKISFAFGRDFNMIAMGYGDIYSSALPQDPNPMSSNNTKFLFSEDLSYRSSMSEFNELLIQRFKGDTTDFGTRILPEAILKSDTEPHERVILTALQMTEALVNQGIKPVGYVFPIILVDEKYYSSNSHLQEKNDQKQYICNVELYTAELQRDLRDITNLKVDTLDLKRENFVQDNIGLIKDYIQGLSENENSTDCDNQQQEKLSSNDETITNETQNLDVDNAPNIN